MQDCRRRGVRANDGRDDKIVLFGTVENLRHLEEAESLFMRVRQKERQIQNLFARFNSGAMSLNDYLEAMKYNTGLRD